MINLNNYNNYYTSLLVEELIRLGADTFFLSPGSRSTPLTSAVAKHEKAEKFMCYDERGAAFAALGYAKSSGKPGVLICSSGTAAANYFPAICEAYNDDVPMIVLTADRPAELRDTGAHQTLDQIKMYGSYVRYFANINASDKDIKPEYLISSIDQAFYLASASPSGPVHINFEFREPLAPSTKISDISISPNINKWLDSGKPYTRYSHSYNNEIENDEIADIISLAEKGIIIVGTLKSDEQRESVIRLADKLNWPVFPDILSGLKPKEDKKYINYFDYILGSDYSDKTPTTVLHIGGRFVSKRLQNMLDGIEGLDYIHVKDSPLRQDPSAIVKHRINADISVFCDNLTDIIEQTNIDDNFVGDWIKANDFIGNVINTFIYQSPFIDEISLPIMLSNLIPDNTGLYLGSGMPIRDFDTFTPKSGKNLFVSGNRGVNGIDGVIASAVGYGQGLNEICTLVIGDISSIHDLNSLLLCSRIGKKTIIIIINDFGGGLFRFLPVAKEDIFEEYFFTPHNICFENAAKLFDLNYFSPKTKQEFMNFYLFALNAHSNSSIIEIQVDSKENYENHKTLGKKVKAELENYLGKKSD